MKVLTIFGTRPEAIKMAPLVHLLNSDPGIESVVCTTGQHQVMLQQVLELFDIQAQVELQVMQPNQSLNGLVQRLLGALEPVLEQVQPDCVLVHGDTTTAMASAMAAFHRKIPVGHVEAGLRTHNMLQPWPEEFNRRAIDTVSEWLFAPTQRAANYLKSETLGGHISITGNTVIDALQHVSARIATDDLLRQRLDSELPALSADKRLVLVTGHRRESFGAGFASICEALLQIAARDDVELIYPVHLNPNVTGPVHALLGGHPRIHLTAPADYLSFVRLMQRAHVILTDSGGVQEEAPTLHKPVLVMRDVTERPEALASGAAQLVGTSVSGIVQAVNRLLDDDTVYSGFSRLQNPYGDGLASQRIVSCLLGRPFQAFDSL